MIANYHYTKTKTSRRLRRRNNHCAGTPTLGTNVGYTNQPTDIYDQLHETGAGTLQYIIRPVPMKALPHTAAPSSLVGTGRDIFLSIDLRYSLFFMCGIGAYTECSFPPERVGFLH